MKSMYVNFQVWMSGYTTIEVHDPEDPDEIEEAIVSAVEDGQAFVSEANVQDWSKK